MKVIFKTNIDHYKMDCFPDAYIDIPPRIGETVSVRELRSDYFINKKLPLRLEVVDVIWTENGVVCELWYKKNDVEAAKLSNIKLL